MRFVGAFQIQSPAAISRVSVKPIDDKPFCYFEFWRNSLGVVFITRFI